MDVLARPPSTAWEAIVIPECSPNHLWAWYWPASGPETVLIQIPPQTHGHCGPLSMRRVLQILALPADAVVSWSVQGTTFAVQGGANPLLDQPLPAPGPWGDPAVALQVAGGRQHAAPPKGFAQQAPAPSLAQPVGTAPVAGMAANVGTERALAAFDADWQALLTLETQLSSCRKQLGALQGQLQSLNRDLNPDERLAADNQDRKDWQDARRWLRDALAQVSRWIRDHDIGMVSAAGNRNRFEEIHQQYVIPRRGFAGLAAACQEFEQHRKLAQNLLVQMQSAQQNASRDGVTRARGVLNRIGAKVRRSKEKRGTR